MSRNVSLFEKSMRILLLSLLLSVVVFFSILLYTGLLFEALFFSVLAVVLFAFFFSFISLLGYVYYPCLFTRNVRTYEQRVTYRLYDMPLHRRGLYLFLFFFLILFFVFVSQRSFVYAGVVALLVLFLLVFYVRIAFHTYIVQKGFIFDYASFKEFVPWKDIVGYSQRARYFFIHIKAKNVTKAFFVHNPRTFSPILQKYCRRL